MRLLACLCTLALLPCFALAAMQIDPAEYPQVPRGDVTDDYHGTLVPDPYRWMEELTSTEVQSYIAAQNEVSFGYLRRIEGRDRLLARMKSLIDYARFGMPYEEGGRYFFSRNSGLQNHSPLYYSDALEGDGTLLLDPNTWSPDGSVSLQTYAASPDGKLLLYAKSGSGSDWSEFFVRDIEAGTDLPDKIEWAKFASADWDKAGTGFYYLRYPEPAEGATYSGQNIDPMIYYHRLGTAQSADMLVFSLPEHPDWWLGAGLNDDKDMLVFSIGEPGSSNNRVYYQRLDSPEAPLVKLLDANDANYSWVGDDGAHAWFWTNKDAPNGRLIEIELANPAPESWQTLIAERAEPLEGVSLVGGVFFASYLKDARTVVRRHAPDGTLLETVPLPGVGTAYGFGGRKNDTQTFFSYTDYTTPTTIYRYDIAMATAEVWRAPDFPIDTSRYESRLLFYRSFDGAAVPLFVMHRKGLALDGANPTILYGYGGFRGTQQPYFSSSRLAWLDAGGVFAAAGIRGGAEYGEAWYQAAIKQGRQVSFNDFIAAAEYLIDAGYTSSPKLAINGGSQGGMLVSAVEMQRPDLFAVVVPQVPVADMLRFNQFTAGKGWERDYGSPQIAEEFAALFAYSPYHNVRPGTCYPATLITTADTDDRVVPSHSFKLAAALQAAQGCTRPVLLRVETSAGHGAGKPLDKSLEEVADIYAFALHNMDEAIPGTFE